MARVIFPQVPRLPQIGRQESVQAGLPIVPGVEPRPFGQVPATLAAAEGILKSPITTAFKDIISPVEGKPLTQEQLAQEMARRRVEAERQQGVAATTATPVLSPDEEAAEAVVREQTLQRNQAAQVQQLQLDKQIELIREQIQEIDNELKELDPESLAKKAEGIEKTFEAGFLSPEERASALARLRDLQASRLPELRRLKASREAGLSELQNLSAIAAFRGVSSAERVGRETRRIIEGRPAETTGVPQVIPSGEPPPVPFLPSTLAPSLPGPGGRPSAIEQEFPRRGLEGPETQRFRPADTQGAINLNNAAQEAKRATDENMAAQIAEAANSQGFAITAQDLLDEEKKIRQDIDPVERFNLAFDLVMKKAEARNESVITREPQSFGEVAALISVARTPEDRAFLLNAIARVPGINRGVNIFDQVSGNHIKRLQLELLKFFPKVTSKGVAARRLEGARIAQRLAGLGVKAGEERGRAARAADVQARAEKAHGLSAERFAEQKRATGVREEQEASRQLLTERFANIKSRSVELARRGLAKKEPIAKTVASQVTFFGKKSSDLNRPIEKLKTASAKAGVAAAENTNRVRGLRALMDALQTVNIRDREAIGALIGRAQILSKKIKPFVAAQDKKAQIGAARGILQEELGISERQSSVLKGSARKVETRLGQMKAFQKVLDDERDVWLRTRLLTPEQQEVVSQLKLQKQDEKAEQLLNTLLGTKAQPDTGGQQ